MQTAFATLSEPGAAPRLRPEIRRSGSGKSSRPVPCEVRRAKQFPRWRSGGQTARMRRQLLAMARRSHGAQLTRRSACRRPANPENASGKLRGGYPHDVGRIRGVRLSPDRAKLACCLIRPIIREQLAPSSSGFACAPGAPRPRLRPGFWRTGPASRFRQAARSSWRDLAPAFTLGLVPPASRRQTPFLLQRLSGRLNRPPPFLNHGKRLLNRLHPALNRVTANHLDLTGRVRTSDRIVSVVSGSRSANGVGGCNACPEA